MLKLAWDLKVERREEESDFIVSSLRCIFSLEY